MRVFRDPDDRHWERETATFVLGAIGGLTLGVIISRLLPHAPSGAEFLDRAQGVARRLRPARLRRLAPDQEALDRLEGAVLDAFLSDGVLGERAVDIGAISVGIIELSGSVFSEEEAHRAVSLANRIPGVRTVVNRLEVSDRTPRGSLRRPLDEDDVDATFSHHEGRVGGMGRRRQSARTDPDRPDDSQYRREEALAAADRDQWAEEGFAREVSETQARPEVQAAGRTRFDEDELDNQDPHGKHADRTLDSPPEELRSGTRVGEGLKPGTRLQLDQSDLSVEGEPPRDRDV
jgi:hypothetical protein